MNDIEVLCPECKNDMKEYMTRFKCRHCGYIHTKVFSAYTPTGSINSFSDLDKYFESQIDLFEKREKEFEEKFRASIEKEVRSDFALQSLNTIPKLTEALDGWYRAQWSHKHMAEDLLRFWLPCRTASASNKESVTIEKLNNLVDTIKVDYSWVCNECGSHEYPSSIGEAELYNLACGGCGGDEFHKEPKV